MITMNEPTPKRLNFDPTVKAGDLLTALSMVIAVVLAYSLLDKRIGLLEEKAASAAIQTTERTNEQKESFREIKSDIKDLQRSVNEISRAVAAAKAR